jgi:hypothetical protein
MDQNILRIKSLKNKKITIYRNGNPIKIPMNVQICIVLMKIKNKEYQMYHDCIHTSWRQKVRILQNLFMKHKQQKINENEVEYGHPYTESWKNMIVNVDTDPNKELHLSHQDCTTFWEDVNNKIKIHQPDMNSNIFDLNSNPTAYKRTPSANRKTLKAKKKVNNMINK